MAYKESTRKKIEDLLKILANTLQTDIERYHKAKGDVIVKFVPKNEKEKEIEATVLYT